MSLVTKRAWLQHLDRAREEELCQLKHEMTQDSSTVPLADAGANDMLREELSQLQQPHVSQENINSNSITLTEEVCWIGGEEPTEEQIRFLVGTGSNDMLPSSYPNCNSHRCIRKMQAISSIVRLKKKMMNQILQPSIKKRRYLYQYLVSLL